jgi:cold shock CspA family protein
MTVSLPSNMACGTIVYYSLADNFGFIAPDGTAGDRDSNVFFHNTRQVTYACNGGDKPVEDGWLRHPKRGERVVFVAETGKRGQRAVKWGFLESYEQALLACRSRPVYRFRERKGRIPISRLQPRAEYMLIWEGRDLTDLRRLYSVRMYPTHNAEWSARFFEKLDEETGKWIECDDPR